MSPQSSAAEVLPIETLGFADFGLPPKLMQSLNRMNFTTPTPVQAAAIPLALAGKDILGSAQTGTGKTGAFGIPLVAKLMEQDNSTALIMTPTRELAVQVAAMIQQLVPVPNIKLAVLIGGEAMPKQFKQLSARPRIVVGTPGRINDHLRRKTLHLDQCSFLVLDETDRMLDMGFGPQLDEIMKFMPSKRQTMLFSATLPKNIVQLSQKYLTNPERIAVGSLTTPIAKIKQETLKVGDTQKYEQLMTELEQRKGSIIVFVKTKYGAQKMADKLCKEGHQADAIHGDLQQRRRDRVISDYRDKRFRILVATDVAARGLDIPHIAHVINYDLPQVAEDYIHRIGRTARAGAEGSAINFVTNADTAKWRAIERLIFGGQSSDGQGYKGKGDKGKGDRGGDRSSRAPKKLHRYEKPEGKYERSDGKKPSRSQSVNQPWSPVGEQGERRPAAEARNYGPKRTFRERQLERGPRSDRFERTDGERRPSGQNPSKDAKPYGKPTGTSERRPLRDRFERGEAEPRQNTQNPSKDAKPYSKSPRPLGDKGRGRGDGKAGPKAKSGTKSQQYNKNKGKPRWAS